MLLYGVCISDIKKVNEEKFINFLNELSTEGYPSFLKTFEEYKGDNEENLDKNSIIEDFLYYYDSGNYSYGLASFLADVISDVEKVNITTDDPDGIHYLGIAADVPWAFNEKTRNLSCEEFNAILQKYINKIADEDLSIGWWNVADDCDY